MIPPPLPPLPSTGGAALEVFNLANMRAHTIRQRLSRASDPASDGAALRNATGLSAQGWAPIVILCPVAERPSDSAVNSIHANSAKLLSRVTWVNGSPSDLYDLLAAGVETARAAIVLSGRKDSSNPEGNENLADDVDAIVVASAIHKLNPCLHVMTEVLHSFHAAYLRPAGTRLVDAEESASSFIAGVKAAAAYKATLDDRKMGRSGMVIGQRKAPASPSKASARAADGAVKAGPMEKVGAKTPRPSSSGNGSPEHVGASEVGAGAEGPAVGGAAAPIDPAASPIADPNTLQPTTGSLSSPDPACASMEVDMSIARERVRAALAVEDTIGRTATMKAGVRPTMKGIFAPLDPPAAVAAASVKQAVLQQAPQGLRTDSDREISRVIAASDGWDAEYATETSSHTSSSSIVGVASPSTDPWASTGARAVPETSLSSSFGEQASSSVASTFGALKRVFTRSGNAGSASSPSNAPAAAATVAAAEPGTSSGAPGVTGTGVTDQLDEFGRVMASTTSAADGAGTVVPFNRQTASPSPLGALPAAPRPSTRGIAIDAAAPQAVAPSEFFGAPAFAAGRAFSASSIDALLCEAHYAPQLIFLIKQLVRASRKQKLQLLPAPGAVAMAMLVHPDFNGENAAALPQISTYGQLFEALLRGWNLLPLGLYRRLQPGASPQPPRVTDPIAQFYAAFTGTSYTGSFDFKNDKALLSFVFTNPPADVLLNKHDFVYVLRPGLDEGSEDL
jgi:hypothetical protein